jgi:hypothetical protein
MFEGGVRPGLPTGYMPDIWRALGAGDAATWGVIMRGCVLGGRRRTSVRAFGAAGVISLKNQGPSGTCGTRRSGVQRRRSQFAARPLGWSDLSRLLEQAGAPAPLSDIDPQASVIVVGYVGMLRGSVGT